MRYEHFISATKVVQHLPFFFQLIVAVNNLNQEKIENTRLLEDNNLQKNEIDDKQREIEELYKEVDDYKYDYYYFSELQFSPLLDFCILAFRTGGARSPSPAPLR